MGRASGEGDPPSMAQVVRMFDSDDDPLRLIHVDSAHSNIFQGIGWAFAKLAR